MTVYGKLKSMPFDELLKMGFSAPTAAAIITVGIKLDDLINCSEFCTANVSRSLLGDNDIFCEGIAKKCAACSARFLMREWTPAEEKQYLKIKEGVQ